MTSRLRATLGLPPSKPARNAAARARAGGRSQMIRLSLALLAATVLGTAAQAEGQGKVPLPQEAHINEQLVAAAAGDMLRQTCPSLYARLWVVWLKLRDLEAYARDQGYTEEEVTLFLKDKVQKARVKAEAEAYLAQAGVVDGDTDSFCRAGRDEIAKGTLVGSLLRSSE